MSVDIKFDPIRLPKICQELREEVREFLNAEEAAGTFDHRETAMGGIFNREFSKKVGARGWIGMSWPKQYGGHERTFLERYVVTEEMRVANAPVRGHFTADRQSGPMLLKFANEDIKKDILPRIAAGECAFSIGMSEPSNGSDLFAAKVRATKTEGGWLINGTKIWTSYAHLADYLIGLFRTSPPTEENRRHGLTNFLVDMKNFNNISVNPVVNLRGQHEFNEVVFEDTFIPDDYVLGEIDGALETSNQRACL